MAFVLRKNSEGVFNFPRVKSADKMALNYSSCLGFFFKDISLHSNKTKKIIWKRLVERHLGKKQRHNKEKQLRELKHGFLGNIFFFTPQEFESCYASQETQVWSK